VTQNPPHGGDHRIQFTPTVKPDRTRPVSGEEDVSTFVVPIRRRHQSVASIPQVISEKDKDRRKREKEEEKKNVNIDEHLMAHQDVAERYKTRINIEKPGESLGLTSQQAEQLLHEHGPNVLTPPKKRHPFLKYLDCLSSLFNLLLILAGILEYILLAIDFKDNFQNVSVISMSSLANDLGSLVHLLIYFLDLFGSHPYCGCKHQCLYRIFPAAKITGAFRVIP
jgi:sodium/potassium-transporting ATPase subunit alpha